MPVKVEMACAVADINDFDGLGSAYSVGSVERSIENGLSCDSNMLGESELKNGISSYSEENDELLVIKPNRKFTAEVDEGDYQGPHDWRKRLKPVSCTTSERPGSGRSGTSRDFVSNGFDRRSKALDAKMKVRDGDKGIERRVSFDDRSDELKPNRNKMRSTTRSLKPKDVRGQLSPIESGSSGRSFRIQRESDFTRQVVKHMSSSILRTQQVFKKQSVQHNLQNDSNSSLHMVDVRKCIEKAQKARLYLLQKTGPNSFLIGGDSPDHKFRVIIGEQKCSCGRGPRCVHVFFVMLRVFQLPETDPRLWSKTLKNYEVKVLFHQTDNLSQIVSRSVLTLDDLVEALLHNFIERQKKRNVKRCVKARSITNSTAAVDGKGVETLSMTEQSDEEQEKEEEEEEELCSICLLEMVDGESLTTCTAGCQNRLHHHCISVWFEECRQQNKQLHCPLCQTLWKSDSNAPGSSSTLSSSPSAAINPRPLSPITSTHLVDVESVPLDPIPADCLSRAEKWLPILGEEIVVRLFSRNWSVRELALRMLGQEAVTVLLRGVGEGRSGLLMSPVRQAGARTMLECCFSILAYMLSDPVYRVYVSGLRALRSMLLYTPCRDDEQQERLQALMMPIVKSLLFKCADSNRRTSQLSIDALLEMVKGDAGELPVGREIVSPGSLGLGGVDFLIRCIIDVELDEAPTLVNWQWLLGRLCMLDRLLEEHSVDFEAVSRAFDSTCVITEPRLNHGRSFAVLKFSALHMSFAHAKVAKMVHRVFYNVASLQARAGGMAIVEQICSLLEDVDPSVRQHMRYRLQKVTQDYFAGAQGLSECSQQFADGNPVMFFVSAQATPSLEVLPDSPVANKDSLCVIGVSEHADVYHVSLESTAKSFSGDLMNTVILNSNIAGVSTNVASVSCSPAGRVELSPSAAFKSHVEMADACVATSPSLRHRCKSAMKSDSEGNSSEEWDSSKEESSRPERLLNRFPLSSEMRLNGDSCDFTLTPSSSEDRVSFKKEVASTPHSSPPRSADNTGIDNCHCKEEVEKEEAQALVAAIERSTLAQDALPFVPGLSREASETSVITINIQDEECCDGSVRQYQEGIHWKRGPVIGTGAFSTCYQARDVQTGTLMAVKQIAFCRNLSSEQQRVIDTVRNEIHLMAKFCHPNIVRILGATQHGCHFFMFVEWMPGCSVAHLLDKYGAFSENVVVSYTQQVLRGLTYLHENGSMHRDLKGANILVDSTGHRVRIGDFGAAARLASRETGMGEFEGQLLGTVAFMAPEVLRGANYGRACDIWSLGCTMIEMITTKPPWGAHDISNHLALIFKIASAVQSPPIPENLSPPLRDMMLRCLEVNPDERPLAKDLLKHPLFTMSWR